MDNPQYSGKRRNMRRKRKENEGWGRKGSIGEGNQRPMGNDGNRLGPDIPLRSTADPKLPLGALRTGSAERIPRESQGSSQDYSWGAIDNWASSPTLMKTGFAKAIQWGVQESRQDSCWGATGSPTSVGWEAPLKAKQSKNEANPRKLTDNGNGCWDDPWTTSQKGNITGRNGNWDTFSPAKSMATLDESKFIAYNGDPIIIESKRDVDIWCDTIRTLGVRVLGFDTEWKPDNYKGCDNKIAVLQLCFKIVDALNKVEHKVLLIRTIKTHVTEKLQSILEDPNIVKAGVDLTCDTRKLEFHFGVVLQGALELDIEYNKRHTGGNQNRIGTKNLVKFVLGLEMRKPQRLQRYNWEQSLTYDSIKYAALDAFVCCRVYEEMIEKSEKTI